MRGKLTLNTVIKNIYLRIVSVYVVRNSAVCRNLRDDLTGRINHEIPVFYAFVFHPREYRVS